MSSEENALAYMNFWKHRKMAIAFTFWLNKNVILFEWFDGDACTQEQREAIFKRFLDDYLEE